MNDEVKPLALPIAKAAKLIGRSRSYMDQLVSKGEIRCIRAPSRRNAKRQGEKLILVSDVEEWLKKNMVCL